MATYVNNLRLKEIATGDESGTWGTSTNTNLELITDGFSYGTKDMAADANETFTMPDATADATRGFYLKITSAVSLTATREVTLGPNTISKVWLIENATTGSQIITIKQGSGATVDVASGSKVMIVTDGAGAGAAVLNANPTEIGGTVTSVGGTGTVNGISLSGTVTSSGNLTLGGTLANVDLTSQVTGTLPIANGGTNLTSLGTANQVLAVNAGGTALEYQSAATGSVTSVDVSGGTTGLTTSGGPVTGAGTITIAGTLAVANGGTGVTSSTGSGSVVLSTSPTLVTPILGTPTSGTLSNCTVDGTNDVGFRNVPQNLKNAAYTLVLADAGKHIAKSNTTAYTYTIPANSSVAYPVGTAITFVNYGSSGDVTIAITSDTMYLGGDGATGSRTLAAYGVATAIKVATTTWVISGTGVS